MSGDDIEIDSAILDVLMGPLPEDMWANEATRNIIEYGASIGVFGPVWDAVVNYGDYPLGIWSDSLFTPEDMSGYMPKIGVKDGHGAQSDGNFHAGSRLSILKWSDFAVVSRPNPARPDDVYVIYLYKDVASGSYKVYRWAHSTTSGLAKTAHVDDLTPDEIDMLGFDPLEAIYDRGFLNRLSTIGKLVKDGPVTCFVLTGRGAMKNTWQGETGKGRPLTRSVINDRFWSPDVPIWCFEFNKPDQPDTWLTAPPDGKSVKWKDDATHQWRRQWGLSQVISGIDRDPPEWQDSVLMDDGTTIEVYVFPFTKSGKSPLDNAAYDVIRNGGAVIDYKNESYHAVKRPSSLRPWGVWNEKVACRTLIRVVPPVWSEADAAEPGIKTDLARAILYWQQGPSQSPIERKLADWQEQFRKALNGPLKALREMMSGARPAIDNVDVTKELEDLAVNFGDVYTRKVLVEVEVPDPNGTKQGGGRRPRRPRVSKVCPDCGMHLPLPGHLDTCPRKPVVSNPAPPIPPGLQDWDGELTDGPGTLIKTPNGPIEIPDPDAVKKEEQEKSVPAVAFPHIDAADWTDISHRGFIGVSWSPDEVGPNGEPGVLRVAWGTGTTPDRYPTLVQAHQRLCDTYAIAADDIGQRTAVEDALWKALVKLLSGKFGHLAGQSMSGTFPKDGELAGVTDKQDHPVIVMGLTVALYGIQDLERFARPILAAELGAALGAP